MENFRTLIRGWLGKVLLVLFLTPLALVGIEGYFAGSNEPLAAKVNGEEITQKELDNWITTQKEQYLQSVGGDETLLNQQVIEEQVYDAAIVRTLLLQHAKKLGLALSDEQLGTLLRQQQAFLQDGQFSQQLLENYLAGNKISIQQLLEDFRKQTSLALLTNGILATSLYSKADADKLIALLAQERTTHLAEVSLQQFAQDFVASDATVKAYLEQHSKDFIRPANVDLNYVVLSKAAFTPKLDITEQEIEQKYQDYVAAQSKDATRQLSHIMLTLDNRSVEQALKMAQEIEAKLKKGEKFEALVQQYSEEPVSKAQQGRIDGYSVGAFGDDFDRAVLRLNQGQISAPVKTEYGYHIIRLDKLDAAKVNTFAEMREQLVAELRTQKVDNAYQDAVNAINDSAVQSDSLQALAEQYKLDIQTAKNVTQSNTHPQLSHAVVKTKLFSQDIVQGDQNISTAINLPNGDVLWFKAAAYHAERAQTMAEAKPKIQALLKREEQIKQAQASVKQLLADLKNKPAEQAIANAPVRFQNMGPIPRYSQVVPMDIEKAIYSLAVPKAAHWTATTVASGDYLFVVAVSAVEKNPAFELDEQQKAQVINRFDARGQQELNDYIEYLRSTAKIKKEGK